MGSKKQIILALLVVMIQLLQAQFNVTVLSQLPPLPDTLQPALPGFNSVGGNKTIFALRACKNTRNTIYVTGFQFGMLVLQRSEDNGNNWLAQQKPVNKLVNGWRYTIAGQAINAWPVMLLDTSRVYARERIYIAWCDEKYNKGNKDVFICYSDNAGDNWTEPILVTYRPNHKSQFKPAMQINQQTGKVYLTYFDQQNYTDSLHADVYVAVSNNGGLKFDYYKINNKPLQLGAETNLQNGFYITDNDELMVWWASSKKNGPGHYNVAKITNETLNAYNKKIANDELEMERTFVFSDRTKISFKSKTTGLLSATVTKPIEPGFEKVVVLNKKINKGNNDLYIDTKALGLVKDNYILTLYYNGINSYTWIITE